MEANASGTNDRNIVEVDSRTGKFFVSSDIRKITTLTEPKMHYQKGQNNVSIIEQDRAAWLEHGKRIFIIWKVDGEGTSARAFAWKSIEDVPCILEYDLGPMAFKDLADKELKK
jgi:hypothetical protein